MRSTHYLFQCVFGVVICSYWRSVSSETLTAAGDVTVVGLFQLFEKNDNGQCGNRVDANSVMRAEAVKWYFNNINTARSLPFHIGFEAFKTCRATEIAAELAIDVLQRSLSSNDTPIVGVIGPDYSSEMEVVSPILGSVQTDNRLVQVGVSTTAKSLRNKDMFPNLIRVIQDEDIQIKAMVKTLIELEWNRIAIVYENDTYGQEGARLLKLEAELHDICTAYNAAIDVTHGINTVDITKIRKDILLGTSKVVPINGVVVFGVKSTVNLLMLSFANSGLSQTPAILVSEGINLDSTAFEDQGNPINKAKGAFAMAPPYREIPEFTDHWKSIFTNMTKYSIEVSTNPWLRNVFSELTGCNPIVETCKAATQTQFNEMFQRQPMYIQYTVTAAHAIAKTLNTVYSNKCGNQPVSTCEEFLTTFQPGDMIEAMKGSTLTFANDFSFQLNSLASNNVVIQIDSNGELLNSPTAASYQVFNYIEETQSSRFSLVKVADYIDETRSMSINTIIVRDYLPNGNAVTWENRRKATCPTLSLCSECIPADLPDWAIHEKGDIYVVGIVPVYDSSPPDGCSQIRLVNGYQLVESLRFAVDRFNEKNSIYSKYFPSIRVGLIILNSCNNPLVVQRKLLNIEKEGAMLASGENIPLKGKIVGFVGPLGSSVSISASGALSKLNMVQISYASTSPGLSDRKVHPFFMRVVTPDDAQAKAMIKMLKKLDADYIQVLYSAGAYGEGGFEKIKEEAYDNDICVVQAIQVREDDNFNAFYEQMRSYPQAKYVIVFLRSHMVKPVMNVLTSQVERGDFVFIGSEAFAKNPYVLNEDTRQTTLGSFSLTQEMGKNQNLDEYLRRNIKPVPFRVNAWSRKYLQVKLNCSYSDSFDRTREKDCSEVPSLQTDPNFVSDFWTVSAYNAMLALLEGAAKYHNRTCGYNAPSLCDDFLNNPQGLVDEVKKVKLDLFGTGTPIKVFTDNGDGNIGFEIYNIQKDLDNPQKLVYTLVGRYPIQGTFTFEKSVISTPLSDTVISRCPNAQACSGCIRSETRLAPSGVDESSSTVTIVLGTLFAIFFIATVVLVVLLLCKYRLKSNDENIYITPACMSESHSASFDSNRGVDFPNLSPGSSDLSEDKLPTTHY